MLSNSLWKGIKIYSPDINRIIKPLTLGILGVAASQINNAVDSVFARYADLEGPAFLWYALRIQQLPLALFGVAIAGAISPPLARAIKATDWTKYHQFLNFAFKQTISWVIPITGFLLVTGDACINLIYGHGDFNNASVTSTTLCLWAYNLGLLPSTLILILAPACYAQNNYRLPMYASFLTMGMNGALNTLMVMRWELGAVSIALATSISAWFNLIFLGKFLPLKQEKLFTTTLFLHITKIGTSTSLACATVLGIRGLIHDLIPLQILEGKIPVFSQSISYQIVVIGWQAIIYMSIYGGVIYFLSIFQDKAMPIKENLNQ